ncbi:conjugal transfer protein [Erwinia sp. OLTSP20]|uniref:type IV secretion system protein n=1 Tax=Enterobacterales TaxID=91347 RepID=UPI000C17F326|nr:MULTISPECIES: type IV secretion system protein [Enterobacterales]PII85144.1 conjugal transfer protein [Serratia sp. OLFL2]PIJ49371.1 conjugal transfer protein [Erwinia sp. OAMSP11]PIJ69766.1 conjugal transfer protein [Erwinia sp. OLSSP12]PIJ76212.1 conjugal transfer protein [Erwinia sp. OLCASP19]PIJ76733.1 conjugal transfer protein [Erwinia sp. OLMTSP26]
MDVQVAATLFSAIDAATKTQMGNVSKVMAVISALWGVFWMIYILMNSLYWYFMGLTQVIQEVLMTMFKASIIMMMAFSVTWYTTTVIPVVTEFPVWLGNTISGTGGTSNNLVDSLIGSYLDALINTIQAMEFSFTNLKATFLGILALIFLLVGGLPFLGVAVGTLITLKCATMLILVIGPIFIAFAVFPRTQQYFWGWVGTLGGFMLAQSLFAVVIGVEIAFVNTNIVKDGEIQTDLLTCLSLLLYFGAFTLLATEIPNYAASIMGGAPSGATGAGGIIGRGTGLGAATKMASKGGKALMRLRRNRIK